jgi:hypothetical protein
MCRQRRAGFRRNQWTKADLLDDLRLIAQRIALQQVSLPNDHGLDTGQRFSWQ